MTQTLGFQIPRPLKTEHDELHAELARATKETGEIGIAAREVARILHPHFVAEEEFALPPLGLLPALARGTITPDMKVAINMTQRLKSELPRMLDEHKAIVVALRKLVRRAARWCGSGPVRPAGRCPGEPALLWRQSRRAAPARGRRER